MPHNQLAAVYGDLYYIVRDQLRGDRFAAWLSGRIPPQADAGRQPWLPDARWTSVEPGKAIIDAASSSSLPDPLTSSIGLLVVIRVRDSLRAVFPLADAHGFRTRFLLYPPDGWKGLSCEHSLRVMHGEIDFGFAMHQSPSPHGRHKGMLMASLAENRALYCGDVSRLGSRCWTLKSPGQVFSFRSTAQEAERHIGIASILYLPVTFHLESGGRHADLVIGLYSPLANVFGQTRGPICYRLSRTDRDFIRDLLAPAAPMIRAIRLLDELLGGTGARISLRSWLAVHGRLSQGAHQGVAAPLDAAVLGLKGYLHLTGEDVADVLRWFVAQYPDALADDWLSGNELSVGQRRRCHEKDPPRRLRITLEDTNAYRGVCAKVKKAVRLAGMKEPYRVLPRSHASLQEPSLSRWAMITRDLIDDLVRNGWKHAADGRVCISLRHDKRVRQWRIVVANDVHIMDAADYQRVLRQYWIVRHSHFPQQDDTVRPGSSGFGLYAMGLLTELLDFTFSARLRVPSAVPALTTWQNTLTIRG